MSVDPAAQAFTAAGIQKAGVAVTFQRLSGAPPRVVITPAGGAAVTAKVLDYRPDTVQAAASGYSASQVGAMTEGDRMILVMSADLAAAGFPGTPQKGDQVVIGPTGEVLVLTRVDPVKRAMAGCIEAYGLGVA